MRSGGAPTGPSAVSPDSFGIFVSVSLFSRKGLQFLPTARWTVRRAGAAAPDPGVGLVSAGLSPEERVPPAQPVPDPGVLGRAGESAAGAGWGVGVSARVGGLQECPGSCASPEGRVEIGGPLAPPRARGRAGVWNGARRHFSLRLRRAGSARRLGSPEPVATARSLGVACFGPGHGRGPGTHRCRPRFRAGGRVRGCRPTGRTRSEMRGRVCGGCR